MKYLIFFLLSFSTFAGVGGISGGTDKFQRGSHIHFQRESTWIHVEHSRTLCRTGDEYIAMLNKCVIRSNDDSKECLKYEKTEAYQPMISERHRCDKYDSDGQCLKWITVPYIQSPKRIITPKAESSRAREKKVIVPQCD